jgi:DNA/RNA endonuclease G (NUC1)
MELTKAIFSKQIDTEFVQYLKKEEYELYYSTKNKYPYMVIERLSMNTGNPTEGYDKVKRSDVEDPFKPDPEIKHESTFTEKDYSIMMSYGLSPGHNAPAGHHHTRPDIWESTFLYSNICPQEIVFNSGLWVLLENWCKFISKKQKALNFTNLRVITGSIPDTKETTLTFGNNNVSVNIPTHMFKIVTARSKHLENNNKLFIGCFLCPNRPIDPMKQENRDLFRWLVPLPVLESISGFNFIPIFTKYYGFDKKTFSLININELMPVKFDLSPIFELQMLKSQWYGIIIYSENLETLENNWKLLKEHPILAKEDLQYHKDLYLLLKDRFNANSILVNSNNNYISEISPSPTSQDLNNSNNNFRKFKGGSTKTNIKTHTNIKIHNKKTIKNKYNKK